MAMSDYQARTKLRLQEELCPDVKMSYQVLISQLFQVMHFNDKSYARLRQGQDASER